VGIKSNAPRSLAGVSTLEHNRAVFNTGTASGAAIFNDAAGMLSDFYLKISGRSLHAFKICISNELDV